MGPHNVRDQDDLSQLSTAFAEYDISPFHIYMEHWRRRLQPARSSLDANACSWMLSVQCSQLVTYFVSVFEEGGLSHHLVTHWLSVFGTSGDRRWALEQSKLVSSLLFSDFVQTELCT